MIAFLPLLLAAAQEPVSWQNFEKVQLDDRFVAEGGTGADFDGDGHGDVTVGPWIWFGPDFDERIAIYEVVEQDIARYSDHFFSWAHDFDGDGALDLLRVGFPGARAEWYRNPGGERASLGANFWDRHLVFEGVDNESPDFTDVNGDGRPELVCMTGGRLGWADWDPAQPGARWSFHPVSAEGLGGRFTHGLGVGDVDGDGRQDLLMKQGWWRQPASLDGDPQWEFHAHTFAGRGGAQMHVFDVDGDGDSDVVTAENAHGYGLHWFEQIAGEQGGIDFRKHRITGATTAENPHGVVIGNLHAMDVADMNGDGLPDLITGARYWAHGGGDAADHEPALLYWFELERDGAGARFTPHMIDGHSGVGTQVDAVDLNGDGLPEVVVGNKMGAFVHRHTSEEISAREARARLANAVVAARARDSRARPNPIAPTGEDGEPLNLGFERGDLSGWTADGEAFANQPVQGDTVAQRRAMRSMHEGDWWIGTYELVNSDGPTGTLTSAPFPVTHPFASFLVGGGHHADTCVELLDMMGRVFYRASGKDDETMHVRWVDLRERVGQPIQIRLIDGQTGHWGHVNFDDFRFHPDQPEVRERAVQDMQTAAVRGLRPEAAAAKMTVPDGFQVELIAGEPDLHQPIAFTIDAKGRLWVAEAYAYPQRRADDEAHDTILVFEDTDGDGQYDQRTTFTDELNLVSGLEVGHGGVWVGAAPYLLFIPDADDDLVPDSEPQILLDGWGYQDTHETLNAFRWGPDGWLYGCHGVFTHSRVGKPGTPDAEREPINAGVWRYHPTEHEFEVFAWGSSNPWGIDWNDEGQAVITACVIPHLYHVIQGGRYQRQAGRHFSPYIYDDIKTVADHLHYLGATPHSGNGLSDAVGGGHAHCGAMIYLSDQFPEEYRDRLYMFNVHGKRMNSEILKPHGSGLVGSHAPDFLLANDPWFMGVAARTGPDGSVYMLDWYDEQACHRREVEIWDRSNGRMYRVSYGQPDTSLVDLTSWSDVELARAAASPNEWIVRTARRLLMERGGSAEVHAALDEILFSGGAEQSGAGHGTRERLRALWALHVTDGWDAERLVRLVNDRDEHVRAWTVQLWLERAGAVAYGREAVPQRVTDVLAGMAAQDASPVVRLALASALQRLPVEQRWGIAAALMGHGEDDADHNLPKMIWYGFEPCIPAEPFRALELVRTQSELDLIDRFTFRRVAEGGEEMLDALVRSMVEAKLEDAIRMLDAMTVALADRPDTPMPASWPQVSRRFLAEGASVPPAARDQALTLALQFGDTTASAALAGVATDPSQPRDRRVRALDALASSQDAKLGAVLLDLLDESELRGAALQRMAAVDDPLVVARLLDGIAGWTAIEQESAAAVLAARPKTARALLAAIDTGRAPEELLDAANLRRQLTSLGDDAVDTQLEELWGKAGAVSKSAAEQIAQWKAKLTPEALGEADLAHGRTMYRRTCYACHKLFGDGSDLGPDITGSNRADLDYILGNIIDPNAEVGRQYMMATARLKDGRVVAGMISDENEQTLTFRNGPLTEVVRRADVARGDDGELAITRMETSLMPPGQLDGMSDDEVRDLIAYLASPMQVPLPAETSNLVEWFDGETLDGWTADPDYWSVENGEIVARAPDGLDHNDFAVGPLRFADFRMIVEVKLVDDQGNSGIQFRSRRHGERSVAGPQADIGADWWGKLYDEHGRGLLEDEGAAAHVKRGDWNVYEIVAVGNRVQTALNGHKIVDRTDDQIPRRGIVALQLHSGGPTEVRFRNFRFELSPPPVLATVE